MAVGAITQDYSLWTRTLRVKVVLRVTQGMSQRMWLVPGVRSFPQCGTTAGDRGRPPGTPGGTAELQEPFVPPTKLRSHPGTRGGAQGRGEGCRAPGEQLQGLEVQPSTDVAMIMMLTVAKRVLHFCCVLGTMLTAWPCAESNSLRQVPTFSCYGEGKLRHRASRGLHSMAVGATGLWPSSLKPEPMLPASYSSGSLCLVLVF